MKYYLVINTTYFYDPHGTPDFGSEIPEVLTEEEFKKDYRFKTESTFLEKEGLEEEKEYYEEWPAYDKYFDSDTADFYAEDGYNAERTFFIFKEINEYLYNKYKNIILEYNKILAG